MEITKNQPPRRASAAGAFPASAAAPRVFEVDGGHVVLDTAPDADSAHQLRGTLRNWRSEYVTLLVEAAPDSLERTLAVLAGAAGLFDRLVICGEGSASDAAAAAVEAALRT